MKDDDYRHQLRAIDAEMASARRRIETLTEDRRRLRVRYNLELPSLQDLLQDYGMTVQEEPSFDVLRVVSPENWYLFEVASEAWRHFRGAPETREEVVQQILDTWNRYLAGYPPPPLPCETKQAYYESERQWSANRYTQAELDEIWEAMDSVRAMHANRAGRTDEEAEALVKDKWKVLERYQIHEGELLPARESHRDFVKLWPALFRRRCLECCDRGYLCSSTEKDSWRILVEVEEGFDWSNTILCPSCAGRPQDQATLQIVSVKHNTLTLEDGSDITIGGPGGEYKPGDSITIGIQAPSGETFQALVAQSGMPDANGNVMSPEAIQQAAAAFESELASTIGVPVHLINPSNPAGPISIGGTVDVVSDEEES